MVQTKMSNNQHCNPLPPHSRAFLAESVRPLFFFQFSIERWSFCFPKLGHMTLLFARGFPLDFSKTITIIVLVKSN